MRLCDHHGNWALALKALQSGGRKTGASSVEWDVAGDCQDPRVFTRTSRNWREHAIRRPGVWDVYDVYRPKGPGVLHVTMVTRCRACPACLRAKRRMWFWRAMQECERSQRTWFVTLTLKPSVARRTRREALLALARKGLSDTPGEIHEAWCSSVGSEITRWLKRVREESGAKLRYLLVAEQHKSGVPHFHLLVHEVKGSAPVLGRMLNDQWRYMGYTDRKIVWDAAKTKDEQEPLWRSCGYVCKYVSKSMLARVRASLRYGVSSKNIAIPGVKQVTPQRDGAGPDQRDRPDGLPGSIPDPGANAGSASESECSRSGLSERGASASPQPGVPSSDRSPGEGGSGEDGAIDFDVPPPF